MLEIIFCKILIISITAIPVIGIIVLSKKLFKNKLTVSWHYYIWLFLLARLLIPFNPGVFEGYRLPFINEATEAFEQKDVTDTQSNFQRSNIQSTNNSTVEESISDKYGEAVKSESNKIQKSNSYNFKTSLVPIYKLKLYVINILSIIWITGVMLLIFYTLIIGFVLRRRIRKSRVDTGYHEIEDILLECKQLLNIERDISIIFQRHVKVPALYGVIRPKLLIPDTIINCIDRNEIKYVILHELCHYKRKDIIAGNVQLLLSIIHWFNPLIWIALHKVSQDRELLCDKLVLSYIEEDERRRYAETLIKVLEAFSCNHSIPGMAAIVQGRIENLEWRLRVIRGIKKNSAVVSAAMTAAVLIISFLFVPVVEGKVSFIRPTIFNSDGKLGIVRRPDVATIEGRKITSIMGALQSPQSSYIKLMNCDLTELDLSNSLYYLNTASFDSNTKWPGKLPEGFDPQRAMELGKNPGLNVQSLHEVGINGNGVGIAIIGTTLLVDHIEYKDNLKMYEEIHINEGSKADIQASSFASIAVGKSVGMAPEADLYYIACDPREYIEDNNKYDYNYIAQAIDRIIEVNKTLPKENKIRVMCIAYGWKDGDIGFAAVRAAEERAKNEGIFVVGNITDNPLLKTSYGFNIVNLKRDFMSDPNDPYSYRQANNWRTYIDDNSKLEALLSDSKVLMVPTSSRCTASPTGVDDYITGGDDRLSPCLPYLAGLYALACQVKPDINPQEFWDKSLNTGDTVNISVYTRDYTLQKVVNPVKFIDSLK